MKCNGNKIHAINIAFRCFNALILFSHSKKLGARVCALVRHFNKREHSHRNAHVGGRINRHIKRQRFWEIDEHCRPLRPFLYERKAYSIHMKCMYALFEATLKLDGLLQSFVWMEYRLTRWLLCTEMHDFLFYLLVFQIKQKRLINRRKLMRCRMHIKRAG